MSKMNDGKVRGDKGIAKNLNCQVNEEDYKMLKSIAAQLGGMSLSALVRMVINSKLARYKETGDPKDFLDL